VFGANRWDAAEFATETDKEKFTRLMVRARAAAALAASCCMAAAADSIPAPLWCVPGRLAHRAPRRLAALSDFREHVLPSGSPLACLAGWALRSRLQRAADAHRPQLRPGGMRPHSGAAV